MPARAVLNPASSAAAAARIAAAKGAAPGGKAPARPGTQPGRPTEPPPKTMATKRPSLQTEMREAVSEKDLELLSKPPAEPPPKPLTRRIQRPGGPEGDVVAWLWCEPLPPIPLTSARQVSVGRQDNCDLVLPHKEVSRHHAAFKVSGKQITLEDQGSSNGCYVNGKRCATQIVKIGDHIQIGPYEIEVRAKGLVEEHDRDKHNDTKTLDLTSLNSGGPNASMTGKLSEVSLVEILQGIEFNAKTCTLAISDGKLRGEVIFAAGRPVTATFGGERDLPAIRAMLRLGDGRFVLTNQVEAVEPTLSTTITAVLLDASREIDEASNARAAPAAAAVLAAAAPDAAVPEAAVPEAAAPEAAAPETAAPEAAAPEAAAPEAAAPQAAAPEAAPHEAAPHEAAAPDAVPAESPGEAPPHEAAPATEGATSDAPATAPEQPAAPADEHAGEPHPAGSFQASSMMDDEAAPAAETVPAGAEDTTEAPSPEGDAAGAPPPPPDAAPDDVSAYTDQVSDGGEQPADPAQAYAADSDPSTPDVYVDSAEAATASGNGGEASPNGASAYAAEGGETAPADEPSAEGSP